MYGPPFTDQRVSLSCQVSDHFPNPFIPLALSIVPVYSLKSHPLLTEMDKCHQGDEAGRASMLLGYAAFPLFTAAVRSLTS